MERDRFFVVLHEGRTSFKSTKRTCSKEKGNPQCWRWLNSRLVHGPAPAVEKFKMTDRRRRRSGASAKEDVDRDERQQAAEELINDNDLKRRHEDEEKRTLLEELAGYEPRTAYD
jgi:hypothetical protein